MIDLEAHLGRDFVRVGYDTMMRILDADKVEVTEGDLVCLRTGYDRVLLEMGKHPTVQGLDRCAALDGRDEKLLQWITDTGLAALISDNAAVEALPPGECHDDHCSALPLHAHCLFRLGVPLGEMWLLSDLADWLRAHQRSRFFLTAPPLRLPGAIGSPVTPVATV